jgi:hypothetical protein
LTYPSKDTYPSTIPPVGIPNFFFETPQKLTRPFTRFRNVGQNSDQLRIDSGG